MLEDQGLRTNDSRSPMAEAVLLHLYTQRPSLQGKIDLKVDSAGTDAYHVGEEADDRTVAVCRRVRRAPPFSSFYTLYTSLFTHLPGRGREF